MKNSDIQTQTWFDQVFNFKKYNFQKWYVAFACFIAFVCLGLIFASVILNAISNPSLLEVLWIDSFHFFTWQSNLLVIFFCIAIFFAPKWKIFNYQTFLIWVTAYISVTFLIYNCILLPSSLSKSDEIKDVGFYWTTNVFWHMLNPLVFIGLTITLLKTKTYSLTNKWYKVLGYGLIYPTVYMIYTIVLPFVSEYSVYGTFSDLNPAHEGGGIKNLMFFAIAIIVFVLMIIIYWSIFWYKFNKKVNKPVISKKDSGNNVSKTKQIKK